jgi:hypothetical protein
MGVAEPVAKRRLRDRRIVRRIGSLRGHLKAIAAEERTPDHSTVRWAFHRAVEMVVKKPFFVGLILLPLAGGAVTAAFAPQATAHGSPSGAARAVAYVLGYLAAFGAILFVLYVLFLVSAPYEQKRALVNERAFRGKSTGDLVLTQRIASTYAFWRPFIREGMHLPRFQLVVRFHAAVPADVPPVTLVATHFEGDVDGVRHSRDGIVAQYVEDGQPKPPGYTYPPVLEPGVVLDTECLFNLQMPWDPMSTEPQERPAGAKGIVTVTDHLQRHASVPVEWPIVLDYTEDD